VVSSIAAPRDAATVTGVFYALTYLGFAAPVLVPALGGIWTAPMVLIGAAACGVLSFTATFLAWPAKPLRPHA
jgi:hypothetical protein